jgi:surfeit locus 1 family protein
VSAWRAPAWAWLLTAGAVLLFGTLCAWQLQRGIAKTAQLGILTEPPLPAERLTAASAAPKDLELRRAEATGRYLADRQLLQDGQSLRKRPGYHVWSPLRLRDGAVVLVNRGWIPLDRQGFDGSAPPGEVTVRGFLRSLPEPGVRLVDTQNCPSAPAFPAVVLYPTAPELGCLLGPGVLAAVLLLDAAAPGGFAREWTDFGFPPERHYGYAVQWLGLAVAAVVLFVLVNRKRPA